jgi:RimJ/RimL family protein N-acetyltransferase
MDYPSSWRGERVRLRAIEPEDWERHFATNVDTEAQRYGYYVPFPQSAERTREKTKSDAATDMATAERVALAIEALDTGELVGQISAHGIDQRNGTFEYGIGIFRDFWKEGYATEAIVLLFRYYFDELRFQKANATVYSFNAPSLAMHRKLGFKEEGCIRRNLYTNGEYHDEFWFGMTAEEFRVLYPSPWSASTTVSSSGP